MSAETMPPPVPRGPGRLTPGTKLHGRFGPYSLDRELCNAANTALLLGRPLLLTGEPGCGKTDFAWVMAHALEFVPVRNAKKRREAMDAAEKARTLPWAPLECHVRSEMSSRDLLYHYDSLLRFVDAHHPDGGVDPKDISRYIELRGLGDALTWPGTTRPVLLIDEIDKAPRDLPNDLLQALDVGQFEITEMREDLPGIALDPEDGDFRLQRRMGHDRRHGNRRLEPFVVITSNVEQQLPEPFLRRCVFACIKFPDRARLVEIVKSRPARDETGRERPLDDAFIEMALDVFLALRSVPKIVKKPATAELLDWTEALARYWEPDGVRPWLASFRARLGAGGKVPWPDLPGLECLLKLREDLEQVGVPVR